MTVPHPIQRRYLAEQLVRLRRADEQQRYAAAQRQGRIDPNPRQIDAVIFALKRFPEGGCILADEVGLGKTIEAGLVVAQLRSEGAASRVLLVVPKPLLGQRQDELYRLFGIQAVEGVLSREASPVRRCFFCVEKWLAVSEVRRSYERPNRLICESSTKPTRSSPTFIAVLTKKATTAATRRRHESRIACEASFATLRCCY